MIIFIKKLIKDYYGVNLDVVFGGSVCPQNLNDLIKLKELDGFIVCTGVLKPENLDEIIKKMAA